MSPFVRWKKVNAALCTARNTFRVISEYFKLNNEIVMINRGGSRVHERFIPVHVYGI